MKRKMKRLLGILLSLALVLGLIPAISQTAYADTAQQPIFQFTNDNYSCTLVGYENSGALNLDQNVGKINKIEAIIESEGAEWAQIWWGYWDGDGEHLSSGGISTTVGVNKDTVTGEASNYQWSMAQIQHQGDGKLWWAKVYYNDGTSTEFGTWKDVTSVSVAPTESTMKVGETTALTATITPNDATVK